MNSADDCLADLVALWATERRATHDRFVALHQATPFKTRVRDGIALGDLEVRDTDAASGGRTMVWLQPRSGVVDVDLRLGPGDPVSLYFDDPAPAETVLGTVARRRGGSLGVMVDMDLPQPFFEGGFKLDRAEPQATFDRGEAALRRIRQAKPSEDRGRLREVVYGKRCPTFDNPALAETFDTALNEHQRAAVSRALQADDVALIHGPPGTGKTRTLVEVIRQLVQQGRRVLAVAASNVAVDNLAERLVDTSVSVVRLGHPARVAASVEARTLDTLLEQTEAWKLARRWRSESMEIRRRMAARDRRGALSWAERKAMRHEANALQRDARHQLKGAQRAIIARADVVCATAAGSATLGNEGFDVVVLDEATQATDPVAWIALQRGAKAVLAGDPCQLPPTVISQEAERRGLATTIFDRVLAKHNDCLTLLTVQHRMNETLMTFPSLQMYDGELVASPEVEAITLADLGIVDDPLRPWPLMFVDSAGKGWDERRDDHSGSTSNPGNADRVSAEVRRLLARGLAPACLAVITPYRAQLVRLRAQLRDLTERGLELSTIDGFQGREKEAIIVDLVRSNDTATLGFLTDVRRMNVALTRAKRFLLVVGDSATIGHHPFFTEFLDTCGEDEGWISAWSDDAQWP